MRVPDGTGRRTFERLPGGTPRADALARASRRRLKAAPVRLDGAGAAIVLNEIRSQAGFRAWELLACAVMANHAHVVFGCGDGEDPARALNAFKSYASRALNRAYGRPLPGTWWTQSGSARRLRAEPNVVAAVRYVREQQFALVVWLDANFEHDDGRA